MKKIRCPVCGRMFDPETTEAMPFCSRRCRIIDLGRWLGEQYAIPHVEKDEEDEDSETPRLSDHESPEDYY
ncbi:MAG: DNA gyrase inhibitor YacG [Thermogutta sp.]|nr:DNA gyrase inhibitor YacG [Thermogutta sp.]HOP77563.1 DNA gyrase inhibitor YacG [Thermogutta sp.]HPU05645.1 DNA gyrase inhibitor YacG [Thermogutta sp.]HPZ81998.1 DNA gyrase inhibitor YacG [Thermogutta sp.]HQF12611.1 DNA gyrase inhibitor YacG [Thermogutta sp.]